MAAEDLLTYTEARQVVREVGASSTTNGVLLTAAITGVSKALAAKCGPIIQTTVTDERHDGGHSTIWLREWPVTAVTSVTEYDGSTGTALAFETNGNLSTVGYYPDPYSQSSAPYSGRIHRRNTYADDTFPAGRGNVVVSYTAGRFETTGAVTEDFKAAARMTLENWWSQYRNGVRNMDEYEMPASSFPRYDVPRAALHLLGDEVHGNRDDRPDVLVG